MAAVKSVAKITKPLYNKLGKLEAKRDALQQEIDDLLEQIEKWEYPITSKYGCLPHEIIDNNGMTPNPVGQTYNDPDTYSPSEETSNDPYSYSDPKVSE